MLRFFTILSLLMGTFVFAFAQTGCPGCELSLPAGLSADTIYLAQAPDGQVGQYYDEDLSFRMPMTTDPVNATDPSTPAGLDIQTIDILGVVGLPHGLSWEASQTTFETAEETDGCVKFCGTPLLPGLYEVEVVLEAQVFIFSQQTSFSLFIQIDPAPSITDGFSVDNTVACGELIANFTNNVPSNGVPGFSYLWDFGNGNMSTLEQPSPQVYDLPGSYQVAYQAIVDTADYFLTAVDILDVDCTDLFGAPDLKFDLFDPNGNHVYTAPISNNASLPLHFDTYIAIGEGNYELHVIDDDGGLDGADDLCGVINFNRNLSGQLSAGGLEVNIELYHVIDTVESSETINVYSIPEDPIIAVAEEMPYCEGDSIHLVCGNYADGLSWSVDSLVITSTQSASLPVVESGDYAVFYTSEFGCTSASTSQQITFLDALESINLQQEGNLIRIEDESVLPADFSFAWYYEGNLISSATELRLCTEVAGDYSLVIIDNATGCSSETHIDGAYDENIDCSVSTYDVANAEGWKLYPNPFKEELTIEKLNSRTATFVLFNALGQRVAEVALQEEVNTIQQLADLSEGVYFYQLMTENGMLLKTGSILKQ